MNKKYRETILSKLEITVHRNQFEDSLDLLLRLEKDDYALVYYSFLVYMMDKKLFKSVTHYVNLKQEHKDLFSDNLVVLVHKKAKSRDNVVILISVIIVCICLILSLNAYIYLFLLLFYYVLLSLEVKFGYYFSKLLLTVLVVTFNWFSISSTSPLRKADGE